MRCRHCKTKFDVKYFNQKYCLGTDACIRAFKDFAVELQRKKREREWRKEKKEKRQKLKSIGKLKLDAREPFQKWIRLRDADQNCISCDTPVSDIWDGGHFYKAELYSGLIFHEWNCHKQCRKCNKYLNGNENNYRLGLIKRYGMQFVLELDAIADQNRQRKYSRLELEAIKEMYLKKCREFSD